ncbi:hypothetical protein [uncultured Friedmanniella sp.]|uniref:hypothetical protein n=1 Tax=uncultured Friedmanniella sp. TaxID=335381 RepID=UPI0035C9590B
MTDPTPGTDLELRPPAALARPNLDREITDSWTSVIGSVVKLSEHVAATDFVPKGLRDNAPAVAAAILHGRELGLPPMTSLAQTYMVQGRPTLSAEGLRALVLAAGHDIEVTTTTGATCTMRGRRRGRSTWTEVTWTIDMARAAGLTTKDTWKHHPRQMLQARTSAELCRLVFPDVCHGMGAAEELQDEPTDDQAPGSAEETPKTTVSRATRRSTAKAPAPSGEPVAVSTPAPPLEVDIPLPDAPGPSGPDAPSPAPGPELEEPAQEQTDQQVVDQAAAEAPERDQSAQVIPYSAPKVTASQLRMLGVTWKKLGVTEDEDRRNSTEALVGRVLEGGTTKDLTSREASRLIDQLTKLTGPDQLDDLITKALSERGEQ